MADESRVGDVYPANSRTHSVPIKQISVIVVVLTSTRIIKSVVTAPITLSTRGWVTSAENSSCSLAPPPPTDSRHQGTTPNDTSYHLRRCNRSQQRKKWDSSILLYRYVVPTLTRILLYSKVRGDRIRMYERMTASRPERPKRTKRMDQILCWIYSRCTTAVAQNSSPRAKIPTPTITTVEKKKIYTKGSD